MDERQTQIRERAGLEESRINTDFIEFLNKWSSPVLIGLGLIALGWAGWRYLDKKKVQRVDTAFAALDDASAGGNPSPASLRNIASEYSDVRSVSSLALLQTCDIYLRAAISGIEPGAEIDPPTGRPLNDADMLDDQRVQNYLSQARDLSRQVIDEVKGKPGKQLLLTHGWMRLAAAQEGLGSLDEARQSYETAAAAAKDAGFPELARLAEDRKNAVGSGASAALPSRDALATLPGEQPATPPDAGDILPETPDEPAGATTDAPADTSTTTGGEPGAGEQPAGDPPADPSSSPTP